MLHTRRRQRGGALVATNSNSRVLLSSSLVVLRTTLHHVGQLTATHYMCGIWYVLYIGNCTIYHRSHRSVIVIVIVIVIGQRNCCLIDLARVHPSWSQENSWTNY
jgi:hypothetical protein